MKANDLTNRGTLLLLALVAGGSMLAGCGGGDGGSPMSPAPTTTVPTVTISAAGVSPKEVRIAVGGQVRFTNNDVVNRQINSNPFPVHDACPPINEVGLLTPGQSKMTGTLSLQGACGFHEHLTEGAPDFLGVILVGNANPDDAPPDGY